MRAEWKPERKAPVKMLHRFEAGVFIRNGDDNSEKHFQRCLKSWWQIMWEGPFKGKNIRLGITELGCSSSSAID